MGIQLCQLSRWASWSLTASVSVCLRVCLFDLLFWRYKNKHLVLRYPSTKTNQWQVFNLWFRLLCRSWTQVISDWVQICQECRSTTSFIDLLSNLACKMTMQISCANMSRSSFKTGKVRFGPSSYLCSFYVGLRRFLVSTWLYISHQRIQFGYIGQCM